MDKLQPLASWSRAPTLSAFLGLCLIYVCALLFYRLYLSPLAKFPGSKLTAATGWYETYYQLIKKGGGQFTFQIERWHDQYGPIIRISPHEVHIRDPDYYEKIYSTTRPGIDKPSYVKYQFSAPGAIVSTPEHELHRQRKTVLNPFFSKRAVLKQAPAIQAQADKICSRLATEYAASGKVLALGDLFSSYTADVITKYAFDQTYNFLDAPDFISPFTRSIEGFKKFAHHAIQFPLLPRILARLPDRVLMTVQPGMLAALEYKRAMRAQIQCIQRSRAPGKEDRAQGTIFTKLMDSDLPPHELALDRLMDEASGVVGAGIETTKWATVVTFFHLINSPVVLQRLRQELVEAIPDSSDVSSVTELEKLPWLMACIEEGIRLSYGGVARSPRVSRHRPLRYGPYTIPAGTPVSSSTRTLHHDETVFPDSFAYKPERWLNNPKGPNGRKNLSQYMASFGRGTRMCLGMQLAYVEMILVVSSLFRQFEFELFETDRRDVDCWFDQIAPGVHPDSKGVRVTVRLAKDEQHASL